MKATPGSVNVPVVCAGAPVSPATSSSATPTASSSCRGSTRRDVRGRAASACAKEQQTRERLRAGELGLDFYGLRAKLAAMGVEWVDAGKTGDRE